MHFYMFENKSKIMVSRKSAKATFSKSTKKWRDAFGDHKRRRSEAVQRLMHFHPESTEPTQRRQFRAVLDSILEPRIERLKESIVASGKRLAHLNRQMQLVSAGTKMHKEMKQEADFLRRLIINQIKRTARYSARKLSPEEIETEVHELLAEANKQQSLMEHAALRFEQEVREGWHAQGKLDNKHKVPRLQ
jgi:hypothetical protein